MKNIVFRGKCSIWRLPTFGWGFLVKVLTNGISI